MKHKGKNIPTIHKITCEDKPLDNDKKKRIENLLALILTEYISNEQG